ncbi:uncharacterized protein LACBIDRAFT_334885 [Laccaria bicolor S238N-H82]|uniref:Predicted protein n=1 Tax=Laccaria bicolor (strain S238N-H82 / ATCC MYA-4686) TaxID=486041 RepID=B0E0N5_LACBS|nr:uncharacterized protein LACBIDRAFT_334885 [Laccaria bicolor S238N-H82]EDQ99648.1 predicted protein [Laccaria bicolor S238N-H82]|eukprot:XP_001889759.1 predicted protein [Laccaria bicolor S238N-H82]
MSLGSSRLSTNWTASLHSHAVGWDDRRNGRSSRIFELENVDAKRKWFLTVQGAKGKWYRTALTFTPLPNDHSMHWWRHARGDLSPTQPGTETPFKSAPVKRAG